MIRNLNFPTWRGHVGSQPPDRGLPASFSGGVSRRIRQIHRGTTNHRHHHGTPTGAIQPSIGSGHSFSGMASYYGNEAGSRTASGQRFNQTP